MPGRCLIARQEYNRPRKVSARGGIRTLHTFASRRHKSGRSRKAEGRRVTRGGVSILANHPKGLAFEVCRESLISVHLLSLFLSLSLFPHNKTVFLDFRAMCIPCGRARAYIQYFWIFCCIRIFRVVTRPRIERNRYRSGTNTF